MKIIVTHLTHLKSFFFFFLTLRPVLINPVSAMAWMYRDGRQLETVLSFSHRWIFHRSHFCLNDARLPQSSWGTETVSLNQTVKVKLYWAARLTLKSPISYLMNWFLQRLSSRMVGFPSMASLFLSRFCVGLLVKQKSGWKSTASESNQILSHRFLKTAAFCLSTLVLIFTRAAISPEKGMLLRVSA